MIGDEISCPTCGTKNRIDREKVAAGLQPVCGSCGAKIGSDSHPISVSDDTFAREVEGSALPVLVDLWAPWCAPCRILAPTLDAVAAELAGRVRIVKLNVDENPATADRLQVSGIPTMVLFKEGREVDRLIGAHPKRDILRLLEASLS